MARATASMRRMAASAGAVAFAGAAALAVFAVIADPWSPVDGPGAGSEPAPGKAPHGRPAAPIAPSKPITRPDAMNLRAGEVSHEPPESTPPTLRTPSDRVPEHALSEDSRGGGIADESTSATHPPREGPEWARLAERGIPWPPAQYTGTPLMWRLKFPYERAEFETLLHSLSSIQPRERTAVLQRVSRARDPADGKILLELLESGQVPEHPGTLHELASALSKTAEGARRMSDSGTLPGGLPGARELALGSLRMLARRMTNYGNVLSYSEWSGFQSVLETIARIAPSTLADPEADESLHAIASGLETALGKALGRGEGGYLGGSECFRLAGFLAGYPCSLCPTDSDLKFHRCSSASIFAARPESERLHALLVQSLGRWDDVERRLGGPISPVTEVALGHIIHALLEPPCESHAREAAAWLASISSSRGPGSPVSNGIAYLLKTRNLSPDLRQALSPGSRHQPPPANGRD